MHRTRDILGQILNAPAALWLLLALPAWRLVRGLIENDYYYAEMMHVSGVTSAQLLVLTLTITPVTLILRRWSWGQVAGQWLLARRRYFGVASFCYALLHVLHYLRETGDAEVVYLEVFDPELGIGWLAFLVLVPVALTSNRPAVRILGARWKALQRFVYLAAAATFIHWLMLDFIPARVYVWLGPLVAAKTVHAAYWWMKRRRTSSRSPPALVLPGTRR